MSIDDAVKLNIDVLDKIEFYKYLNNTDSIQEIINQMQNDYESDDLEMNDNLSQLEIDTLHNNLFKYITENDLINYLNNRYNINIPLPNLNQE